MPAAFSGVEPLSVCRSVCPSVCLSCHVCNGGVL